MFQALRQVPDRLRQYAGRFLASVLSRYLKTSSSDPLDYIPRQRAHAIEAQQRVQEMEAKLLANNSQDSSSWVTCGGAWFDLDQFDRAIESFDRALAIDPLNHEAINRLAISLKIQGELGRAIALYRRALEIEPRNISAFQNLLFAMLCSGEATEAEIFEWHLRFAQEFEKPLVTFRSSHTKLSDPARRLRIGYVSADLRDHVTGRCMAPILAHHDRKNFKIYCYFDGNRADDFTRGMQAIGGTWRNMAKFDDAQLCKQVLADRIDILVDLSGHTPGNRILAFARKPAPVQVSYLDYSATTGLASMDYRLTTAACDVENAADAFYTEALVRLPGTYWLYNPAEVPDIAPIFDRTSGGLLLACLNSFYRISDAAILIWAEILRRLPTARLALVSVPTGKERIKILQRFKKLGIDASRIELFGFLQYGHYLQLIRATDIALAPFPYNGAMTTLDCLWNGAPVVCLRGGSTFRSNMGNCVLGLLNLENLIADRAADYVDIAVRLAQDRNLRLDLRAGLRERMKHSAICDASALTTAIEAAYRGMWRHYCKAQ
jgi:predicted O-linked N-acetylglucosamine transferase (SPINDLY family)